MGRRRLRVLVAIVRCAASWTWILLPKYDIRSLVLFSVAMLAHAVDFAVAFKHTVCVERLDQVAYAASHASIINFVFDIPGWACGQRLWWQHALISLSNVAGVFVALFVTTWGYDYALAWHCYGRRANRHDLVDGYCMTWPGVDHPPRGICSAGDRTGPQPGCNETVLDSYSILEPYMHAVLMICAFSVAIYIGEIPAKLKTIRT